TCRGSSSAFPAAAIPARRRSLIPAPPSTLRSSGPRPYSRTRPLATIGGVAAPSTDGLRIGEALFRARTGQGMDVRTAEERTKIRIKYLRALESEDWDGLPSPAYTRG